MQDRPGLVPGRVLGRPRTRALVCRVKAVDLKKAELLEEIKRDCEMGFVEVGDRVAADDESAISIVS